MFITKTGGVRYFGKTPFLDGTPLRLGILDTNPLERKLTGARRGIDADGAQRRVGLESDAVFVPPAIVCSGAKSRR